MHLIIYVIFPIVLFSMESLLVAESTVRGKHNKKMIPVVINTWPFTNSTQMAWDTVYLKKKTALDAVEIGCSTCEEEQCDGTVGYGGSPDENGETTLDALIFDGWSGEGAACPKEQWSSAPLPYEGSRADVVMTMNMGAVCALRNVKNAISVARHVLEHTQHSMLVGDQATAFAVSMGFKEESLQTEHSIQMWQQWKENNCQPNFWTNVEPDPTQNCGPYKPITIGSKLKKSNKMAKDYRFGEKNHDTIGMVAIDSVGSIAAGTSTNGAKYKIPGRVGDSPIPGAGAYADGTVGGAAATGDGDVMMRFLPSSYAVEEMRRGSSPSTAGELAIRRIIKYYPDFVGAIVVLKIDGEYGAACHGLPSFKYSVCNNLLGEVTVESVNCIE